MLKLLIEIPDELPGAIWQRIARLRLALSKLEALDPFSSEPFTSQIVTLRNTIDLLFTLGSALDKARMNSPNDALSRIAVLTEALRDIQSNHAAIVTHHEKDPEHYPSSAVAAWSGAANIASIALGIVYDTDTRNEVLE